MSGFAGIVRFESGEAEVAEDAQRVEKMATAIAYRGPDGQKIWSQHGAHLCFSFLKTGPAPQSQTQPCSLDGHVLLQGDIRLDGREALFRKFAQRGEQVESTITNEDLLLHVYQVLGEDATAELDGDYSCALLDSKKKRLVAFRDATGSKAFFYCVAKDVLSFSNTLKALQFAPGFTGQLDENFLGD